MVGEATAPALEQLDSLAGDSAAGDQCQLEPAARDAVGAGKARLGAGVQRLIGKQFPDAVGICRVRSRVVEQLAAGDQRADGAGDIADGE